MNFIDDPMDIEQSDVKVQEVHQQNRFLHSKRMIIVNEKSQAIVPDKPEKTLEKFQKHKQSLIFQTEQIQNLSDIDDLFTFRIILNLELGRLRLQQKIQKRKIKGSVVMV
ncbi:unnamed protein product (macronuclear) [Paramecium tetraurelia]|uniref:Uncharacterized protein n=1 Tax=Paramecium tetraurelia TaxID=5888 RepID=A0BBR1_PARTE|nr:uncharacterized protein GSPATT00000413001 [Paramecium tetraurelia]CAK55978.1 unnamed protein product [Paramecium tetraurelia]|eukprot:XP_001423376.1 hypothetical protein (macronuclear) [Paramecium tetraurelia strain d4-2]